MNGTGRRTRFRAWMWFGAGLIATATFAHGAEVGAIRWDAWYDADGRVGKAVEASLGPEKYHYRLPFFAQVLGPDQVRIDGSAPGIMEREIDAAADAGLGYWAYVLYQVDDPMSLGLKEYLASPKRDRIAFSLITTPGHYAQPAMLSRIESLLAEKGYLTVLGNRPVLFLGFLSDGEIKKDYGGKVENLRAALNRVALDCQKHGLGRPYLVIMDFSPKAGKRWLDLLGGDALTSYTTHGNTQDLVGQPTPFADLSRGVEWFWDQCRATGAQVVPIIVTGGDRRPRIERPVPWEKYQKPGVGLDKYIGRAAPEEIAAQTGDALRWLQAHPASAPAQLALIYAWNENDEGGWLIPTLGDGTARLDALQKVLRPPPAPP
jgi:hypothetical protein